MSNLSNQQVNNTFDGMLQVPGGITSTLQTVQDGNGNPTGLQLSSTGVNVTTSDNYVAAENSMQITGAISRLIADGFGDFVNVKDFGATGDGVTDDTTAITAAFNYAQATLYEEKAVLFPAGNYIYNGAGNLCPSTRIGVYGDGNGISRITLGASSYFIDTSTVKESINISNLVFLNGLGVYRSTYTGNEVSLLKNINNCGFVNYTKCAIESNANDSPTWMIWNNTFRGANSTTTIGIALPSYCDGSFINGNSFENYLIAIKARSAGVSITISSNFFGEFSAGTLGVNRIAIWLVLNASYDAENGRNCAILNNKFGNENSAPDDYKIVYAEELTSGTYNADKLPRLNNDSSAYSLGCNVYSNSFNCGDSSVTPAVYSTSPNILGLMVHQNQFPGTPPSYIIQYRTPPITAEPARHVNLITDNTIINQNSGNYLPISFSNGINCGFYNDTNYSAAGLAENIYPNTSGANASADYIQLYTSRNAAITVINGSSLGAIADATGDANQAINVSINNDGAISGGITMASVVVGYPTWIEFDLKTSGATPASNLIAKITGSAGDFFLRKCVLKSTWVRYRFPFQFSRTDIALFLQLLNNSGSTVTFSVGRIRIYHAREPISFGRSAFEQMNLAALPTSASGLTSGSLWVDAGASNVIKIVP